MRRVKFIFSILISLILLIRISNTADAITISTSETPSSVNSESEFSIIIKCDEKVTGLNAYISYDPNLVTMSAETTDPNMSINPTAGEGELALMYAPIQDGISKDTFEIKVKAKGVTAETIAQFKISDIKLITELNGTRESLPDKSVSVTINKQTTEQTSKPTTTPTTEETSQPNQYPGKKIAKTGENEILLIIISALIVSAIVMRIKYKNIMK